MDFSEETLYTPFDQLYNEKESSSSESDEWNRALAEDDSERRVTRRPQVSVEKCTIEELRTFANTSMLLWPHPPRYGIDTRGSLYGSVYVGQWMFTQQVIVKQTRKFDDETKFAVFHEFRMSDQFKSVTPRCLAMSPNEGQLRIAFDYLPTDLHCLMQEDLSTNFYLPDQLARIMSEFEDKKVLIRDFRLTKFMAEPSRN